MQEPRDMTTMKLHLAVLFDQVGDPPRRPQLGAEAVGHGSFEQQLDDFPTLPIRQRPWPTGGEAHLQRLFPAAVVGITPTHHRAWSAAEDAAYLVEGKTFIEQTQGLTAARVDQLSRTLRSRHWRAPVGESRPLLHYLCDDQ